MKISFIVIYGVGEAEGVKDGEVGIFEIVRDKISGHATSLSLAFAFAGHTSDVIACGWSPTGYFLSFIYFSYIIYFIYFLSIGKKLVTCCEDGLWRLWDTTIQYYENEKPRLFSGDILFSLFS